MGRVKISTEDNIAVAEFEFIGSLDDIDTIPNATAYTFHNSESIVLPIVNQIDVLPFTAIANNFILSSGENIALYSDANRSSGYKKANVIDRFSNIELGIPFDVDTDYYNDCISNNASITIDIVFTGAPLKLTMNGAQLIEPFEVEYENGYVENKSILTVDNIELLQGYKTAINGYEFENIYIDLADTGVIEL